MLPMNPFGGDSINDMGGKSRAVAGTIDTVMDLTSKFIPAMQKPADWWDEVSGRKEESDPEESRAMQLLLSCLCCLLVVSSGALQRQPVSLVKPS